MKALVFNSVKNHPFCDTVPLIIFINFSFFQSWLKKVNEAKLTICKAYDKLQTIIAIVFVLIDLQVSQVRYRTL